MFANICEYQTLEHDYKCIVLKRYFQYLTAKFPIFQHCRICKYLKYVLSVDEPFQSLAMVIFCHGCSQKNTLTRSLNGNPLAESSIINRIPRKAKICILASGQVFSEMFWSMSTTDMLNSPQMPCLSTFHCVRQALSIVSAAPRCKSGQPDSNLCNLCLTSPKCLCVRVRQALKGKWG